MITLKQGFCDLSGITNLLNKHTETELELNSLMIKDDINKLRRRLESPLNKNDKQNMERIVKYLEHMYKAASIDDTCTLNWLLERWALRSKPFELRHFIPYNIRTTDYINISSSNLVHIDFRDVYEIIAFEMMHRDLDESMRSMEEKLDDIGIATVVDSSKLTKFIVDSPLNQSKFMRIGSSPYATVDGKLSWDYFGTAYASGEKAFTSRRYEDCVTRSVEVAELCILRMILSKFCDERLEFRICAINEDGFYFLIDNLDNINLNKLIDTVVIRAFGRKFEVVPKIKVF